MGVRDAGCRHLALPKQECSSVWQWLASLFFFCSFSSANSLLFELLILLLLLLWPSANDLALFPFPGKCYKSTASKLEPAV